MEPVEQRNNTKGLMHLIIESTRVPDDMPVGMYAVIFSSMFVLDIYQPLFYNI